MKPAHGGKLKTVLVVKEICRKEERHNKKRHNKKRHKHNGRYIGWKRHDSRSDKYCKSRRQASVNKYFFAIFAYLL